MFIINYFKKIIGSFAPVIYGLSGIVAYEALDVAMYSGLERGFNPLSIAIFFMFFLLVTSSLKKDCLIRQKLTKKDAGIREFLRSHGVIALDRDSNKVVYVNPIACKILKKKKEELLGKNLEETPICCLLTCDSFININK